MTDTTRSRLRATFLRVLAVLGTLTAVVVFVQLLGASPNQYLGVLYAAATEIASAIVLSVLLAVIAVFAGGAFAPLRPLLRDHPHRL